MARKTPSGVTEYATQKARFTTDFPAFKPAFDGCAGHWECFLKPADGDRTGFFSATVGTGETKLEALLDIRSILEAERAERVAREDAEREAEELRLATESRLDDELFAAI